MSYTDITGQDLTAAIIETMQQADEANAEVVPAGTRMAQKKAEYEIALADKMLVLRDAGAPASIVEKLAKGTQDVAAIAVEVETSKVLYEASKTEISLRQTELKTLNDMANREWGAR